MFKVDIAGGEENVKGVGDCREEMSHASQQGRSPPISLRGHCLHQNAAKKNQMQVKFTNLSVVGAPLGESPASIGSIGNGFQLPTLSIQKMRKFSLKP